MIAPLLTCLLLLQVPRDGALPQPMTGTAVISGVVTTGEPASPVPLRRAIVTLTGTGIIGPRKVATDDQGRFAIDGLAAGRFTLTAEKAGYLTTYVGSRRPGRPPSTPLALTDGQRMTDVPIHVVPGAAIEGTLRDEQGRPIAAAQVSAWSPVVVDGQTQFVAATSRASRVLTDDRGHFRIWGLLPGTYVVEATGGSGTLSGAEYLTDDGAAVRTVTRALVYAPGVSRALDATPITLAPGEERAGVDIVNPLAPSSKLTLIVSSDAGEPLQNVFIGIASLATRRVSFSPGSVRPDAEGRFTLPGLSPGRYLFYGRSTPKSPDEPALWLRTEVEVGTADAEAALTLKRGQKVSGKLTADGAPPEWAAANLLLSPLADISGTGINMTPTHPAADGSFDIEHVAPGRYMLTAALGGDWKLSSAMLDGKDTLDYAIEVSEGRNTSGIAARVSKDLTSISGLVTDALGRPSPEFSVVVFAADAELRRTSPRRTSGLVKIASDGRFKVEGLPPGDYLLAVIVDADPQQLQDRAFLEQIAAGAIQIRLAEGQKVVQDLKIGG